MRQPGYAREDTTGWPTGVLNRTIRQCNPILILDPTPYPQLPAPSFSPQWESGALSVRRHADGKEDTPGQGNRILIDFILAPQPSS